VPLAESAFAHLAVNDNPPVTIQLDVLDDSQGYFLLCNDTPIAHCETLQQLAPLLHGQIVSDAYARADCLIAFHAAAISNGQACLVFPALSGSGKSTLTAALVAAGFQYCTDELALLQNHTHHIRAIPAGIGLKSGSWDVLQAFHPQLSELPTHLRLDGQSVRYLLPDKNRLGADPTAHQPLRALVFPVYNPHTEVALEPLTPADALCRLTEAGTDMAGGLNAERVTELVDWIGAVDSYALRYASLDEAIAQVRTLLT